MLSETKIDDSFPKGQFLIKWLGDPFRLDKNVNGGAILLEKIFRQSFYLLKLCRQKVFFMKLIDGKNG